MMNIMAVVADYSFVFGIITVTPIALFAMSVVDEIVEKMHNSPSDRKVTEYWTI